MKDEVKTFILGFCCGGLLVTAIWLIVIIRSF